MRVFLLSRSFRLICLVTLVTISSPLAQAAVDGRLEGTVRDAETKSPLAGAAIQLIRVLGDPDLQGTRWDTVTDSSGAFSFTIPEHELPGEFFTTCYRPGYVPSPPDHLLGGLDQRREGASTYLATVAGNPLGVVPIRQGQVARAEIGLTKGGSIRGRLTCRHQDGVRPCALKVTLLLARPPKSPHTLGSVVLDTDGRFAFEDLFPSTAYSLEFNPDGYARSTLESIAASQGNASVIDREFDRTSRTGIEGTFLIEGIPAQHGRTSVIAVPPTSPPDRSRFCSSQTRGDGSFSCFGLPPGTYRVALFGSREDGISGSYETSVTLAPGQTQALQINVPRRGR